MISVGFFLGTVVIMVVTYCLWKLLTPVEALPGTKGLPFSALSVFFQFAQMGDYGMIHEGLCEWNSKYGPAVFFKVLFVKSVLVISDAKLVESVVSQSFGAFPSRGQSGMAYFIPKSLLGFEHNNEEWKKHRHILSGAFTDKYLKQYASEMTSCCDELVEQLRECPDVPDITSVLVDVTYRILIFTIFGREWYKIYPSIGTKEQLHAILNVIGATTFLPKFLWKWLPIKTKVIILI